MNILYLTVGNNISVHLQAAFSIYSFLSHSAEVKSVNVITDNPSFYNHLRHKINIISITEKELQKWHGEYHFFWRVKIKAIEKICHLYPGEPVMYLDTDTFLYANADKINASLFNGRAVMHENEGPLASKKSKTEKKMWQQVKTASFAGIKIPSTACMWNAGVVATPNILQGKEMELALNICDDMCRMEVTRRLIEQFALSVALEKYYGIEPANESIAHYWSTKELWNRQISNFFLEAHFAQWNNDEIIAYLAALDSTHIPVFKKIKNTNLRLKAFIDKVFPHV